MHETNFKKPRASKVDRFYKRMDLKREEDKHKAEVRRRDKTCRVPLCGCKRFKLPMHVSHQVHKGMGGDPTGERSQPELMVYVCSARHRENVVSIDRGTLRWRAVTEAVGANGPIVWEVDRASVLLGGEGWFELARERSIGAWEPLAPVQRSVLVQLAQMLL